MNSLYEQYGPQQPEQQTGNPMIQRFLQFRNSFSGDPRQTVQNLIASGRLSQSQFNMLAQQATQLQKMFHL